MYMNKYLLALLLSMIGLQAQCEIDSLYNSKWKVGLTISLLEMPLRNESGIAGHLIAGIPIIRNIHRSFFNLESGIYYGGFNPIGSHSDNPFDNERRNNFNLPVKVKYDRDGMFLASGISNWYYHSKYNCSDFYGYPISIKNNFYLLNFNFTMGFEKYVSHDCEIFVNVFYERLLAAYSMADQSSCEIYLPGNIGFSLGFFIRGN
ncbi:hypothetical protein BH11BAC1_BH11BAC1_01000 [soil metagenome]